MGEQNENRTLAEAIRDGFARTEEGVPGDAPVETAPMEGAAPVETAEAPVEASQDGVIPGTEAPAPTPEPAPTPAPAQEQTQQIPPMMRYLMDELNAQRQQNAQLAAQLQQSQATVQEQSKYAQNAVETAANQPSVTVPVLDFNELQYDDDTTRAQKIQDWQNAMVQQISDVVARQYAGQLQPIKEEWEANKRVAEEEAARQTIWADPRFADFKDKDARIRQIIDANPELKGAEDPRRAYLMGGFLARGMDYQPNPSAEEIVKMVQNSPEAQRLLDSQRAQQIADRNQQIPTIQPSSGLATANAIPDSVPKTKDDLYRMAAERLGASR